jgi:hypothetical protein
MAYSIEAKILPIAGLSGHLYIEIYDDKGARITQVNGFAIHARTGKVKAIGVPGDRLRAFVDKDRILGVTKHATRDNPVHRGVVLFKGEAPDIVKAITAMQLCAYDINRMDLRYNALTQNSNGVFSAMIDSLQKTIKLEPGAVDKARKLKPWMPGLSACFEVKAKRHKDDPGSAKTGVAKKLLQRLPRF